MISQIKLTARGVFASAEVPVQLEQNIIRQAPRKKDTITKVEELTSGEGKRT